MNEKDKKDKQEFFDKFGMHSYPAEYLWRTYFPIEIVWQWIESKKEEWKEEASKSTS